MKRADQRKFHYLYKITRFDGKYYFGIHSTDNLEDGYFGSGTYLWKSLKRHGKEKHSKEILEFCETRQASKEKEKLLITDEMRADTKCMNIAPGGGGGFSNEDHQKKCTEAARGKGIEIVLTRRKRDAFFDRDFRNKISVGVAQHLIDNPGIALEQQKRITRAAASASSIAKKKITFAERGHSQGEKNSQFGTCWVTNGEQPIKIKKEFLDEYLLNGYSKGRK